MEKFIINGGKKLKGTIEVRGAKNDALVILASALLTSKPVYINRVPDIEDIKRMSELMDKLGVKVKRLSYEKYKIVANKIKSTIIDREIAKRLRASILLTAPLLARMGRVDFPHPGGCVIGERPIDVFLDGYRALGANVEYKDGVYSVSAKKLKGTKFVFGSVSVTGTEAMIMAASSAEGTTILKNCACEPEVESLADFLNNCGAKISGAGTPKIIVRGIKNLNGGDHTTIPDRIEAGSFLILGAVSGSSLKVNKCEPEHLDSLLNVLEKSGAKIKVNKSSIEVSSSGLRSVNIKTKEYPGFPTDLQAPLCVLLTQAEGQALVHETIYEGRLSWTEELKRMGASILSLDPHRIEIKGPTTLRGREIESPDIRAGMAYIVAALCAEGESIINNVYQIDRGYEKIEKRLQKIGADIKRV
ncbi:MAG: UDP-N-acetylglucosamine 1-carboxyvinyltransferase [Candidatus Yanofskybacteria bacterium RIFCSPHIGHO2_02_FULL_41_29]|uniref:UDP-N-acetylglucosamine 1-carboxyvinyltransferase n=1 Tax=Candidatus Yanofskybacteria bacterium RIFCSPHIGHO2_01_FULL_41_53 TaxID=1802663 RepID=A0A1F8EIK8_9BACT|nr:MAG: UDP-N-acetylglucosamine 1-carboxyvinyltransferase [Candidatus Yanofskybacteria bacterium RIFCSPHIGHO2_01_FULL_41_53]OGN11765.1 MAG: UDP-N-acetylglucosamine 1-carboxyvinyltransferase [Candidatus Yanofskybacteria bacterium RIFCSPHIGHO2_02_FULL_41_29]OGN18860.1 MAG: UDP-N-acetylglucosamine 1-carboxyvinyltransferase [Candidatus Yanofskybacteria bacterium RIFCSPHIGHO2_12_FULL_41_9]OGN22919.1 MAG: UDP-N-acetylglucosamine 1-carboxyvinyltransferase [Candidatus Yanofskybacteria bacterium RIFCSPLO